MKVSLCVSGKWTGTNHTDLLRKVIPHDDFYTATYTGSDYEADFYMDEPEVTYHPILDTEAYGDVESRDRRIAFRLSDDDSTPMTKSFKKKAIHWNKQILIHNNVMRNIPPCDIVIRSRFDVVVSHMIDWSSFIKESFDNEIPIGFNTLNLARNSTRYHHMLYPMQEIATYYINDAVIIHPYKLWDCDLVDRLHREKKLRGAEEGWYQILSEPNNYYHKSYSGGAYIDEFWDTIKDVDESLHN